MAHDHVSFQLEILVVCVRYDIIKKEQFYLDYYKLEYNILTKAGPSLSFKHSEKTLFKFKSCKLSDEALSNLRKTKIGAVLSPLAKTNLLLFRCHIITLKMLKQIIQKKHSSIGSAAI